MVLISITWGASAAFPGGWAARTLLIQAPQDKLEQVLIFLQASSTSTHSCGVPGVISLGLWWHCTRQSWKERGRAESLGCPCCRVLSCTACPTLPAPPCWDGSPQLTPKPPPRPRPTSAPSVWPRLIASRTLSQRCHKPAHSPRHAPADARSCSMSAPLPGTSRLHSPLLPRGVASLRNMGRQEAWPQDWLPLQLLPSGAVKSFVFFPPWKGGQAHLLSQPCRSNSARLLPLTARGALGRPCCPQPRQAWLLPRARLWAARPPRPLRNTVWGHSLPRKLRLALATLPGGTRWH